MTGCIRCGASGVYVTHPLKLVACDDCYRAWIRDESCSFEVVEAAVGWYDRSRPYAEHCKRFDAELLARTQAWAKEGR